MRLFKILIPMISIMILSSTAVFAENPAVATVNGKPLTAFELNAKFQDLLPMEGGFHGGVTKEKIDQIKEQAMNALIDEELQYQYAVEKKISVSSGEVKAEFTKIEKKFDSSKKFKEALKQSGITKDDVRFFLKKRLLAAKAKETEVTSKAAYTESDVKDYYEKHVDSYKRPEEFKASHILIKVDPTASNEEKEKSLNLAKELIERIKKGENFEDLAGKYSDDKTSGPIGGILGTFHKGMADKTVEEALLPLKVGEISDVVETIYGYHIFKLTGRRPETQLTYDDVKVTIKDQLEKKKKAELYKNWMDELKGKAKIEIVKQ